MYYELQFNGQSLAMFSTPEQFKMVHDFLNQLIDVDQLVHFQIQVCIEPEDESEVKGLTA